MESFLELLALLFYLGVLFCSMPLTTLFVIACFVMIGIVKLIAHIMARKRQEASEAKKKRKGKKKR